MSRTLVFGLLLISGLASAEGPGLIQTWGTLGTGAGEWVAPARFVGVPAWTSSADNLLVVDRPTGRVQRFGEDGTILFEWDAATTELVDPVAVTARSIGVFPPDDADLFVLDAGADAVLIFRNDGSFVRSFPVPPFDDGDIAHDTWADDLAIVLSDRHVVQIYGVDGTFVRRVGVLDGPGSGTDRLSAPHAIARIPDGGGWVVSDTGNDRIVLVDRDDGFLDSAGTFGTGDGDFDEPLGLTVDCRLTVHVADHGNERVVRYRLGFDFGSGNPVFDGPLTPWFEGEGLAFVDLGFAIQDGIVVAREAEQDDDRRVAFAGDFFALTDVPVTMRRYEGPCCPSGFFDGTGVTATTAGGDLRVTPARNGPTLAEVGATVEIVLQGACEGDVVAGYPFQDVFLDDDGTNELNVCLGGSVADGNSDAEGRMTISSALAAGGSTQTLRVYVAGQPVADPLPIRVVSPDINADRAVNVSDVGTFATDFSSGVYVYRADMNLDEGLDLSDVGIFAAHIGETCP